MSAFDPLRTLRAQRRRYPSSEAAQERVIAALVLNTVRFLRRGRDQTLGHRGRAELRNVPRAVRFLGSAFDPFRAE